jgi:SanA protein
MPVSKNARRKGCLLALLGVAGALAFPVVWRDWVQARYGRHIYGVAEVRPAPVAIVFGAAVYGDGRLSPMLRDRMETAVRLYEAGKVGRLLLSGGERGPGYDEPARMRAYALERGVPAQALQMDSGGRRTYDTCYRARHVFGAEAAILVTQAFHLPRALFTCQRLGGDVVGVAADLRAYHPRSLAWSESREVVALLRALVDVVWGGRRV